MNALITGCNWNNIGTFISGFDFTTQRDSNILIAQNLGMSDYNAFTRILISGNSAATTVTTAGTYYKVAGTNTYSFGNKFGIGNNSITYYSINPINCLSCVIGSFSSSSINRTVIFALRKSLNVSTVTGQGTKVTITTTTYHNLISGDKIQMLGWSGGTGIWNGVFTITVTDTKTFTYAATGKTTATGGTCGALFSLVPIRVLTAGVPFLYAVQAIINNLQLNEVCELYLTSSSNGDKITVTDLNWVTNMI